MPQQPAIGAQITEQASMWRLPGLGGVELLRARYRRQNFSKHFHECFAVGVIQAGALKFDYRGGSLLAAPGEINLCLAGETHNGQAAHETGWQYRMFYVEQNWLQDALPAACAKETPYFPSGVLQDPQLAREILLLHQSLEPGRSNSLEQESRLLTMLNRLLMRHAFPKPHQRRAASCPRSVSLARDYLADNLNRNPSLSELSRVAGLSRFHLLRVFSSELGLTPHAYQVQLRLQKARDLMNAGRSLAEAALASGFSDQSHFSRHFKRVYGLTPGQYRKSLQSG